MTKFEKDAQEIRKGNSIEVMKRRKAELEKLEKAGRCEKNGFRRKCIAQDFARLEAEYDKLDVMI